LLQKSFTYGDGGLECQELHSHLRWQPEFGALHPAYESRAPMCAE
jgi:hypothetical protein